MKSFKNKEDYKSFLSKLPKNIHRPILHYLVTAYWIMFVIIIMINFLRPWENVWKA